MPPQERLRSLIAPRGSRRETLARWLLGRPAAPPGIREEPPAPAALAHKPFLRGTCNVCGQPARFFRDDPSLDRESLTCEHCRTTSRYRSIARGVLRAIARRTGLHAHALALLPAHADVPRIAIYDTQSPFFYEPCAYPLPELLARCDWIDVVVSSYRPGVAPGSELSPGVVNQNLERLTFDAASFDVVITSDVMEHVRLDDRAHAEIARVLKPGGVYVFTVPHFRDRREHFVRVQVVDPDDPSRDVFVTDPEYHGDANAPGGRGALSYRSYGTALREELDALGFDVDYSFDDDSVHAIRNTELFYCTLRERSTQGEVAREQRRPAVSDTPRPGVGDGRFPAGHFYSPVVDRREVAAAADRIWPAHPPEVTGVDFNEAGQRAILTDVFPRYIRDYDYPDTQAADAPAWQFFDRNPAFGWLDSRALFVLLRHWQPRRVIEVGSGYSTLLMADVNRRFLDGRTRITAIEPYPPPFLVGGVKGLGEVVTARVQDVPLALFDELAPGDVLFIDSSHVSKVGSDVNHLYFEVLPRLVPGVRIHVHDVFLPFDYPREWVLNEGIYWNEQYLLRALLTYTRGFRVLFGSAYVNVRCYQDLVTALAGRPCGGGSFWMERVAA